jgi:hypothetical protein
LGHREIIAGDVIHNRRIEVADANELNIRIGGEFGDSGKYDPKYDLNADGKIDQLDYNLILKLTNFWFYHYEETLLWLDEEGIPY